MSNSLPSSFDGNRDFYEENRWQKFSRRLKEEPLIPIGCALTCYALWGATRSIRAGDHATTNRMFRARIYAQGFTLLCLVAGSVYWSGDREKRAEFDGVVAERKALEKKEAWIRELEARDREDKEWKSRREEVRKAVVENREREKLGESPTSVGASKCIVEELEDRRRSHCISIAVKQLIRR